MTECYSARCQQDRKIARREFNKWTKNLLFQVGLETISKNHFEFDVNLFNQTDDEQIPIDFSPNQPCLFCHNRQEYLDNKKSIHRINEHHQTIIHDDDENAPLDLSLKSTTTATTTNKSPLLTSNNRTNVKQRPIFDIKSDISPMYGQEEFDRFMSEMITSQLEYSSQPFLNMNLFPTLPIPQSPINKKKISLSQDARIAQLAKQMAYERMLQEIDYQRHPTTNKKSKISMNSSTSSSSSSSVLTESIHVNHILNDVMMRILHDMYEKQQPQQQISQPRASRKGELLFVKKQNINNDDQYNFINNTKKQHKHDNKSSSSSSTSSISSTGSSTIHTKLKSKSINYIPKGRSIEMNNNNNSKIHIGMDGKQIRPKRGQYRRYESEQLAKAVAAVLSNEMSVHKAGSYFGVPHSTLEYKVKERNTKMKIKDEDDEKSSKDLTNLFLSTNSHNPDESDNDNNNNDDDDDDLEE